MLDRTIAGRGRFHTGLFLQGGGGGMGGKFFCVSEIICSSIPPLLQNLNPVKKKRQGMNDGDPSSLPL